MLTIVCRVVIADVVLFLQPLLTISICLGEMGYTLLSEAKVSAREISDLVIRAL